MSSTLKEKEYTGNEYQQSAAMVTALISVRHISHDIFCTDTVFFVAFQNTLDYLYLSIPSHTHTFPTVSGVSRLYILFPNKSKLFNS